MTSVFNADRISLASLRPQLDLTGLLATALIVLVSSLAAFATTPALGEAASALIFMLGITLAGAFFGLTAGLLAAVSAFLLYNFYLTEPVLALRLATGRDVAPLVVFNLCAIVTGVLAGRLKDRAQAANRSNRNLSTLLGASQALQRAVRPQDVAVSLEAAAEQLGLRIGLLALRGEALVPLNAAADDGAWLAIAEQALHAADGHAGAGTIVAHRLEGSEGPVGVMVVEGAPERFDAASMAALANLIALALERAMLSERIAESRAAARTEELKTALLSSVSHDFRTPLTAISASASSLIDYRDQLDEPTSLRFLRGIVDECDRLNRYTANLLEMGRLEAGQGTSRRQILSVGDMLGTVIQRVRGRAGNREIVRVSGAVDPLVSADASLFELVLVNVLDNAVIYSADGSRIEVDCVERDGFCRITIADEGQGIPEADLERVFERFHRVIRPEPSPRGSGLGLAIARSFVEALDGDIVAQTPGIGTVGTRIVIRLPVAPAQAAEPGV
jgi:two-component system sensor histidine kinase KdpD